MDAKNDSNPENASSIISDLYFYLLNEHKLPDSMLSPTSHERAKRGNELQNYIYILDSIFKKNFNILQNWLQNLKYTEAKMREEEILKASINIFNADFSSNENKSWDAISFIPEFKFIQDQLDNLIEKISARIAQLDNLINEAIREAVIIGKKLDDSWEGYFTAIKSYLHIDPKNINELNSNLLEPITMSQIQEINDVIGKNLDAIRPREDHELYVISAIDTGIRSIIEKSNIKNKDTACKILSSHLQDKLHTGSACEYLRARRSEINELRQMQAEKIVSVKNLQSEKSELSALLNLATNTKTVLMDHSENIGSLDSFPVGTVTILNRAIQQYDASHANQLDIVLNGQEKRHSVKADLSPSAILEKPIVKIDKTQVDASVLTKSSNPFAKKQANESNALAGNHIVNDEDQSPKKRM